MRAAGPRSQRRRWSRPSTGSAGREPASWLGCGQRAAKGRRMSEVDRMLAANEEWAHRFPGSKDTRPARKVAIVACMDSRMPLFQMLGLEVGDAHVIRNAGG